MRWAAALFVGFISFANCSCYSPALRWSIEDQEAVDRFAHFLRFKTVSNEDVEGHVLFPAEFEAAHHFLNQSFPVVYSTLAVEQVANFSLLFKWEGSNPDALPFALLSHQDVVPAEEGPDSPWSKPPFGGEIENGWVYGRGALDTKFSLMAILQAAEELLKDGFTPHRTVYFSFGHDEEVGGECGAVKLAQRLADRGVQLEFVVDEGGEVLTDGIAPLTTQPVALISTAEKGFETVEARIHAPGGHSSRPPLDKSSVLEVMGRLLTSVSNMPPPLRLVEPVPAMLKAISPGASSSFYRYIFRHSQNRLVRPVVNRLLARWTPGTAALVRTTVAPTLASAGVQDNVLPESGKVAFNFRTLPGEDELFAEDYLWERIGSNKSRTDVQPRNKWVGAGTAPAHGQVWNMIARAIRETHSELEDLLIAPNLLSGATDSRHYSSITKVGLYRFSGISVSSGEIGRVHGVDERVKAQGYLLGVKFFKRILELSSAP